MTREELTEIQTTVRRAMEEKMEMYDEVWISEKELCKTFGALTPAWCKRYWSALHARGCVRQPGVTDEHGVEHKMGRQYARNKIQRLFATGEIEHLQCRAVVS